MAIRISSVHLKDSVDHQPLHAFTQRVSRTFEQFIFSHQGILVHVQERRARTFGREKDTRIKRCQNAHFVSSSRADRVIHRSLNCASKNVVTKKRSSENSENVFRRFKLLSTGSSRLSKSPPNLCFIDSRSTAHKEPEYLHTFLSFSKSK